MNPLIRPLTLSLPLTACALAVAALVTACGGGAASGPPDLVPPTVSITDNVAAASTAGPVTFTFAFSESVGTSFITDDVVVSGGTKGAFAMAADGKSATLVVTPTANATGTIKVDLASGVFSDLAGNMSTAAYSGSQDFNTITGPTTAPTAPTAAAANVKSLYSEAYTTTSGFDIPNWGQGQIVSEITVAANKVLKGDLFTYQGFQFDPLNATTLGLTTLHIDVWAKDATPVKVYVISAGQDTESVDVVPTAGAWKGVDIPLSSFTKINKGAIFQLKLDTAIQPVTKVLYFDNIYFTGTGSTSTPADAPTTAPTAPTAAASSVKSLYSDAYPTTGGFDIPNWGQGQIVSDVSVAGNKVLKGDLFTYQGFQFDALNATTLGLTTLHIDVWSKDATPVKAYVISAGQDSESVTIVPTAGAWKGVDIPLSSFTKINKAAIFQLKLDTGIQPTTKVMYFDNIYFGSAGGSTTPPASAPTTAPTAPTVAAANVKSLYSDAYATTGGFDIPNWGQSQLVSDTTLAGNHVLKGDLFTYQGFQFDPLNATTLGLTNFHIDVWSADATPVKAYIISAGQDSESVTIVPTAGAWKGVDIPLSSFTKIDKSAVFQIKLDTTIQPTTKVMYFDNLYFWK